MHRPSLKKTFSIHEATAITSNLRNQEGMVSTFYTSGTVMVKDWKWESEANTLIAGMRDPFRVKIEITAPGAGISDNIQVENTTLGQIFKYRGDVAAADVLEVDNRYDTDDFEVLNDGADDKANFEGDFITLAPGNNTIEFTGTASTGVKITYRAAYY